MTRKIKPIHPGEVLKEDFLKAMEISAYKLARDINVPRNRITGIINGDRSVSAETALLLSKYFNMSENYWMNLQARYDIEIAKDELSSKIHLIKPVDNNNKNFAFA